MTAPKNQLQATIGNVVREAGDPADQQERISYGEIIKVNATNSQVHVKIYGREDKILLADQAHPEGKPIPIIQPLSIINHLYGALSTGMKVRIFWTGKHEAKSAYAEVIGGEDFDLKGTITKEPEANRQDTLPYLTLSGGIEI